MKHAWKKQEMLWWESQKERDLILSSLPLRLLDQLDKT
jgi:hypothetical protein